MAFIAMYFLTLAHILSKTIASALLLAVSGNIFLIVFGSEMCLYLLYKAVRCDFSYYTSVASFHRRMILSFAVRVVRKILADFTVSGRGG